VVTLNDAELACLKKIANDQSSRGMHPCSDQILEQLSSKGLIELAPTQTLPLAMAQSTYALTAEGRMVLAQL